MVLAYRPLATVPRIDDVVWCLFPDGDASIPGPYPRPVLVRQVEIEPTKGHAIIHATYGTTTLKPLRAFLDLVIDDPKELAAIGLRHPTRFDLAESNKLELVWCEEFFSPPQGLPLQIGSLPSACCRRLANRLRWRFGST